MHLRFERNLVLTIVRRWSSASAMLLVFFRIVSGQGVTLYRARSDAGGEPLTTICEASMQSG